ncbi:MAG TPA: SIMPL domain-containing protein [Candidatus Limnocylindrales bacterium]
MATTITIPTIGPRARWLAVAAAATAVLLATSAPSFAPRASLAADPTAPQHTISVSGTGRVILAPDVADLRLGVVIQRSTVKAARADAATKMTAVIAALKKAGIADADIQTSAITLNPQYDYTNGNAPRLIGYQFSNSVAVTVRKLDSLGDAIDGALAAGATTLDSVSFRVDDETKAEAQARTQAMADAKSKAQALATAAGVSIEGVASITETVAPTPYPVYFGAAAGAAVDKAVATPVQAGTNEVSVSVAVVYLIP